MLKVTKLRGGTAELRVKTGRRRHEGSKETSLARIKGKKI